MTVTVARVGDLVARQLADSPADDVHISWRGQKISDALCQPRACRRTRSSSRRKCWKQTLLGLTPPRLGQSFASGAADDRGNAQIDCGGAVRHSEGASCAAEVEIATDGRATGGDPVVKTVTSPPSVNTPVPVLTVAAELSPLPRNTTQKVSSKSVQRQHSAPGHEDRRRIGNLVVGE